MARAIKGELISKVDCGCGFTLALTEAGHVYSWGRGAMGQTGHGTQEDESYPRRIDGLSRSVICDISCGGNHSLAIDVDGKMYSWGRGNDGRLGTGKENSLVPEVLTAVKNLRMVKVACGWSHCISVSDMGQVCSVRHCFT